MRNFPSLAPELLLGTGAVRLLQTTFFTPYSKDALHVLSTTQTNQNSACRTASEATSQSCHMHMHSAEYLKSSGGKIQIKSYSGVLSHLDGFALFQDNWHVYLGLCCVCKVWLRAGIVHSPLQQFPCHLLRAGRTLHWQALAMTVKMRTTERESSHILDATSTQHWNCQLDNDQHQTEK